MLASPRPSLPAFDPLAALEVVRSLFRVDERLELSEILARELAGSRLKDALGAEEIDVTNVVLQVAYLGSFR